MNKYLGVCFDDKGKYLGKFDMNDSQDIVEHFKQVFPGKTLKIRVIPRELEQERLAVACKIEAIPFINVERGAYHV
jgi:hypothetical protein